MRTYPFIVQNSEFKQLSPEPQVQSPLLPASSPEPRAPSPARLRRPRRGVVLLIVVSLLALFILLGATFTLVAMQALNASKLELRISQVGDAPDTEMDMILGQILYDTQARTVLQYHSLLRDLYGDDRVQGTVVAVSPTLAPPLITGTPGTSGQFFTIQFNPAPPTLVFSPIPNYYVGRVITFQTGAAANQSARIVAYAPLGQQLFDNSNGMTVPQFAVEAIESKLSGAVLPAAGDTFVINGAPFNGTGVGYDAYTYGLDAALLNPLTYNAAATSVPDYLALLPNYASFDANLTRIATNLANNPPTLSPANYIATAPNGLPLPGGLDESYDAVDFQNMFLAMIPPRAAELYAAGNPSNYLPVIPSFHRPELVNYWLYGPNGLFQLLVSKNVTQPQDQATCLFTPYGPDRVRGTVDDPTNLGSIQLADLDRINNVLRGCIMRPMPWDHPNFNGSNYTLGSNYNLGHPYLNILASLADSSSPPRNPWDVDNDNDGLPDSVWIDPGLPIVTTPEGKRYKRLVALLIKDLDGSINLNAHGNLAQVQQFNNIYPYVADTPFTGGLASNTGVNNYSNAMVSRGLGFGPAEVSFHNLLGNPGAYANLLQGRYASGLRDPSTGYLNDSFYFGATTNLARPGRPNLRDPLAAVKHNGVPNDYGFLNNTSTTLTQWYMQPSWYASPPDVWGRGAVVLDYGGQPLFTFMGQGFNANLGTTAEMIDSPYELSLSGEDNGMDSPYTVAELEAILRYHDPDATQVYCRPLVYAPPLAQDSRGMLNPSTLSHARRNMLTTISYDIPAPATTIPPEMRPFIVNGIGGGNVAPGNASILDLYRQKLANNGVAGAQASFTLKQIVPWEFFKGQKFDLNRPFGDGLDNDNNGARDDAGAPKVGVGFVESTMAASTLTAPTPNTNQTPPVAEYAWAPSSVNATGNTNSELPASFYNVQPRYCNSLGPNATDNYYARQLYARHLFCLAMLMLPEAPNVSGGGQLPLPFFPNLSAYDAKLAGAFNGTTPYYQTPVGRWMIRRIAQWAVNCVDYRDSDSIMTPFEFDYNPFNGWQVDGNLATDGVNTPEQVIVNGTLTPTSWSAPQSERGVVWGMEAPDLLITETFALHDRRVKDTNQDGGAGKLVTDSMAMPPDPTLDQFRVPQGSLFVELYSTRPTRWTAANQTANQKPQMPLELYNTSGQLNLAALSPQKPAGTPDANVRWPVWRLAMSKMDTTNPNQTQNHPVAAVGQPGASPPVIPETASFDPISFDGTNWTMNMSTLPGTIAPLMIDRFAYLGTAAGLPTTEKGRSYYNTGAALLSPGQYAVIGPRDVTFFGSQVPATPTSPPLWGGNSPQKIQMTGTFAVYDTTGTQVSRTAGTDMRQPLPVICNIPIGGVTPCSANAPWSGTNQFPLGMNVTEPLPLGTTPTTGNYYPEPIAPNKPSTTGGAPYPDFYDDPDSPTKVFKDMPVESPDPAAPSMSSPARPIAQNNMNHTGTYFNVSSVFLQRLANPALAYNPPPSDANGNVDPFYNSNLPVNPYITVDWQTIDVNVFSGEENLNQTNPTTGAGIDIYDPNPTTQAPQLKLRSRQRGFMSSGTQPTSNPWPPVTLYSASNTFENLAPTVIGSPTTGPYLTVNFTGTTLNSYTYSPTTDRHSLGYLNSTVDYPYNLTSPQPTYVGEPYTSPFPWIAWNNRPFTNAMELLSVPASSPGRMFLEMTPGFPNPSRTGGPYQSEDNSGDPTTIHGTRMMTNQYDGPFGSYLNFFETARNFIPTGNNYSNISKAPHFYRMLDFVEVPSPFAGTERWYNPQNFQTVTPPSAGEFYAAPFNKLSRFRDPGRININTIFDEMVWHSAASQFWGMWGLNVPVQGGSFYNFVALSRQGYGNSINQINQMSFLDPINSGNTVYMPTRFANPFRTADSADMMPNYPPPPALLSGQPHPFSMRKFNPIEATLLRPHPLTVGQNATPLASAMPLFEMNSKVWPEPYRNPDRTAYFRNQGFQKLGSVLTTHSNCFAVWMTVGYFEVEEYRPATSGPLANQIVFDAAHPDGYALGQELGIDTGEVTRHRGFFIIDRSIPVGFVPGSRMNTDDCVLVRRLIE